MPGDYSKRSTRLLDIGTRAGPPLSSQSHADTLTYEPYFGLNEKPFSLNADSRFVYRSPTYIAASDSLSAGIRRREGLNVLTGEIGTGKTTLCRRVLAELGRNTYSSLVPDPFASREDLLRMLLIDFGVFSIQELTTGPLRQASRTGLGYLLSEFLDSLAPDAFVVVIIDEAQNLSLPLIEETRILSDTFGAEGRLQIVFVGQPELHAKLKLPEMRQVDQRICGYHRLAPMTRESVAGYIEHRLQVAGGSRDRVLFPPEIVDGLHRRSGGVPRLINRVCNRALQLAYERQAENVNQEILETALMQVGATTLSPTWDSIIYAEPPAPPPAQAPTAAAAVATTPPIDDHENFRKQVDHWVAQDLASAARPLRSWDVEPAEEAPVAAAPERRSPGRTAGTAPRRQAPARVVTDWPRDLRSETYMHRLWRIWAKRATIALAVFVVINVVIVGVSLLPTALTPPTLPPLPAAPAIAIRGLSLPEAPPTEALAALPAEPSVANSAEYLVAVGLYASRDRANRVVDALTQAGLPAMQRSVQFRRQQLEQIVLGPFFSRPEAVEALVRLQLLGGYGDATVIDSSSAHSPQ